MNVMMTLGGFQFGITTAAYQELTRATEYRWPSQDRFQQLPALQYVGPGGDTITLPGVIYPEFNGGTGQLDAIRALAARGVPYTMISGTGTVLGEWVIERVEDKGSVFATQGVPRKQEFTLNLRKYADEAAAGRVGAAGKVLGAASLGTVAIGPLPSLDALNVSVGSQAGGFAASLGSYASQVGAMGAQLGNAVSGVLSPISRAVDTANSLKNAAATAKSLLGSVPTTLSGIASASSLVSAASTAVANSSAAGSALKRSLADLTALGTVPRDTLGTVQDALVTVNQLTVAATSAQSTASNLLNGLRG